MKTLRFKIVLFIAVVAVLCCIIEGSIAIRYIENEYNKQKLIENYYVVTNELQYEDYLVCLIGGSGVAIFISILLAVKMSDKILKPVKKLTEAVDQMTLEKKHNYVIQRTNDEIEELSVCIQDVIDNVCFKMNRINERAYKDVLTGIKNKTAFNEYVEKYDEQIRTKYDMFGIVVLDINNLKKVNDNYGHDMGDIYINNCCQLICNIYEHSPIFRIGGDEFVCILENQDLSRAVQLQENLYRKMGELHTNAKNDPEKVSIAAGMAVFWPGGDTCFNDVFKRADEAMYHNKRRMKVGKKPIISFPRNTKR